jgi:hypothetical protein
MEQETQKHGTRIESFKANLQDSGYKETGGFLCTSANQLMSTEGCFRADKESSNYSGGHAGDGVDHTSAKGVRSG